MAKERKPYTGVLNIVRFNWHFYLLGTLALIALYTSVLQVSGLTAIVLKIFLAFTAYAVLSSLIVSFFVYDLSGFYKLDFLDELNRKKLLNLNAGFDEISKLLKEKYPDSQIEICDFYNSEKHTEVSIKRARKIYPVLPGTIQVATDYLPFENQEFDCCLIMFSAHEIRDDKERILFFKELNRVLKPHGEVVVVEHLRDFNNFLAYNLGFFHFLSEKTWLNTFEESNFAIKSKIKKTPFVTVFKLKKNGDSF